MAALTEEERKRLIERGRSLRTAQQGAGPVSTALERYTPGGLIRGGIKAGIQEGISGAKSDFKTATRQPTVAGKAGSALRTLVNIPARAVGAGVADIYQEAGKTVGDISDVGGRFTRALLTGEEKVPVSPVERTTPVSAGDDMQQSALRQAPEESKAVKAIDQSISGRITPPEKNFIRDSAGNTTFIDPNTGEPITINKSGEVIERNMPTYSGSDEQVASGRTVLTSSSPGVNRQWVNRAPISPDYGFGVQPSDPQRIADLASPDVTLGEAIARKPLLRAAALDQRADIERESMGQKAQSDIMDRQLRAAELEQRGKSDAADIGLRQEQLEQQGQYQQGQLAARRREMEAKAGERMEERGVEAARQQRLQAAISIYDSPDSSPELKQRARRVIEANRGKAEFDLGESSMTEEQAAKSLQDTWKFAVGKKRPDPTDIDQLQNVAQANPTAWRAAYGNASPSQVQRYNSISRMTDKELMREESITSILKEEGIPVTADNIRAYLEADFRVNK